MTFSNDLKAFTVKLATREQAIFTGVVEKTADEFVNGGLLTGAPGQPEDLRGGQFTTTYEEEAATIATDDPSAPSVEDGFSHKHGGPITLHSPIGGFHSRALVVMGFPLIVEDVARKVTGSDA